MAREISRRSFLGTTAVGAASLGAVASLAEPASAETKAAPPAGQAFPPARSKVRVGKFYMGFPHPGWPAAAVDVAAEHQRLEEQLAKLQPAMPDVEFVDCGLVTNQEQLGQAKQKLQGVDGILFLQLTMGVTGAIRGLLETNIPTVLFSTPYCGHEWHTIASMQREGQRIDCWPTSKLEDIPEAIRPFRAIHRLKEAKILYVNQADADPKYVKAMKEKFGSEIKSLKLKDLEEAYQSVDAAAAQAEADEWVGGAEKVVEPTKDDILKASRMSIALRKMVEAEQAAAITINCLGSGLIERGMGYPCLGFARLNSTGSGGICEADLKSTMTHLIFLYLCGRPGFVTDPVFDFSNSTIIHAHCVAATQMEGPQVPPRPYIIRSHLEDNRGAVLQVKMPVGKPLSMARLIGDDLMLFSTGQAVDSPIVDRGCRTKVTMRVENPEKFLENWSCGLHRVVFYGDHTRDIRRFCRFMKIRLVREGIDDLQSVPGLEWEPHVHA